MISIANAEVFLHEFLTPPQPFSYEVDPGFHIINRQEIRNGDHRVVPDCIPGSSCLRQC